MLPAGLSQKLFAKTSQACRDDWIVNGYTFSMFLAKGLMVLSAKDYDSEETVAKVVLNVHTLDFSDSNEDYKDFNEWVDLSVCHQQVPDEDNPDENRNGAFQLLEFIQGVIFEHAKGLAGGTNANHYCFKAENIDDTGYSSSLTPELALRWNRCDKFGCINPDATIKPNSATVDTPNEELCRMMKDNTNLLNKVLSNTEDILDNTNFIKNVQMSEWKGLGKIPPDLVIEMLPTSGYVTGKTTKIYIKFKCQSTGKCGLPGYLIKDVSKSQTNASKFLVAAAACMATAVGVAGTAAATGATSLGTFGVSAVLMTAAAIGSAGDAVMIPCNMAQEYFESLDKKKEFVDRLRNQSHRFHYDDLVDYLSIIDPKIKESDGFCNEATVGLMRIKTKEGTYLWVGDKTDEYKESLVSIKVSVTSQSP